MVHGLLEDAGGELFVRRVEPDAAESLRGSTGGQLSAENAGAVEWHKGFQACPVACSASQRAEVTVFARGVGLCLLPAVCRGCRRYGVAQGLLKRVAVPLCFSMH